MRDGRNGSSLSAVHSCNKFERGELMFSPVSSHTTRLSAHNFVWPPAPCWTPMYRAGPPTPHWTHLADSQPPAPRTLLLYSRHPVGPKGRRMSKLLVILAHQISAPYNMSGKQAFVNVADSLRAKMKRPVKRCWWDERTERASASTARGSFPLNYPKIRVW